MKFRFVYLDRQKILFFPHLPSPEDGQNRATQCGWHHFFFGGAPSIEQPDEILHSTDGGTSEVVPLTVVFLVRNKSLVSCLS